MTDWKYSSWRTEEVDFVNLFEMLEAAFHWIIWRCWWWGSICGRICVRNNESGKDFSKWQTRILLLLNFSGMMWLKFGVLDAVITRGRVLHWIHLVFSMTCFMQGAFSWAGGFNPLPPRQFEPCAKCFWMKRRERFQCIKTILYYYYHVRFQCSLLMVDAEKTRVFFLMIINYWTIE